jgi:hypothetical protein
MPEEKLPQSSYGQKPRQIYKFNWVELILKEENKDRYGNYFPARSASLAVPNNLSRSISMIININI